MGSQLLQEQEGFQDNINISLGAELLIQICLLPSEEGWYGLGGLRVSEFVLSGRYGCRSI